MVNVIVVFYNYFSEKYEEIYNTDNELSKIHYSINFENKDLLNKN